jgi:hypothetical protein
MTRPELEAAQFLLGVAQGGGKLADLLDPERGAPGAYGSPAHVAHGLASLASKAARLLQELTGRMPHEVSMVELNTEHPAAWTKEKR